MWTILTVPDLDVDLSVESIQYSERFPLVAGAYPRVQRTRPYASLRGSPLTRHPLGRRRSAW